MDPWWFLFPSFICLLMLGFPLQPRRAFPRVCALEGVCGSNILLQWWEGVEGVRGRGSPSQYGGSWALGLEADSGGLVAAALFEGESRALASPAETIDRLSEAPGGILDPRPSGTGWAPSPWAPRSEGGSRLTLAPSRLLCTFNHLCLKSLTFGYCLKIFYQFAHSLVLILLIVLSLYIFFRSLVYNFIHF